LDESSLFISELVIEKAEEWDPVAACRSLDILTQAEELELHDEAHPLRNLPCITDAAIRD
jgi:hypothetical protein